MAKTLMEYLFGPSSLPPGVQENMVGGTFGGQTPEEYDQAYGDAEEALRRSVLERNRNSGDLDEAIAQAQMRYEDAMRARGLDPSEFIGDSGRIAYPPLDFANAANRAAAQEMYRRGGMAALASMDPEGYGAYKDFEPTPQTDAYAEYLLPPGVNDMMAAERDYDILRAMQEGNLSQYSPETLRVFAGPAVPFSRHNTFGRERGAVYYPRYAGMGSGIVNALQSGTDNPVASALRELEYIPNAHYYAVDAPEPSKQPNMTSVSSMGIGVPNLAKTQKPHEKPGDSFVKAGKQAARYRDNRGVGRDVRVADMPYGSSPSEISDSLGQEAIAMAEATPGMGTDYVRSVTGLDTPAVVGDAVDLGVSIGDGTQLLNFLGGWKSGLLGTLGDLKTDAAVDVALTSGMGSAYGGNEDRTWKDYLFKPVTERKAFADKETVDKTAREDAPSRRFGTLSEARQAAEATDTSNLRNLYNSRSEREANIRGILEERARQKDKAAIRTPAGFRGYGM